MVSSVKPLAVIFLDMDGVMSDRLYSQNQVEEAYQEIKTANPIYSDYSSMTKGHARGLLRRRAQAQCLSPEALKNLESLIKRVSETMQVAIVIASSWREELSLDELKDHVFVDCSFCDLIIDKTPDDDSTYQQQKHDGLLPADFKTPSDICNEKYGFKLKDVRGRQIHFWLNENCKPLNIYSYVIIDHLFGEPSEISKYHRSRFVEVNPNNLFTTQDADLAYEILNTEWLRKDPDKEASMQTVLDPLLS